MKPACPAVDEPLLIDDLRPHLGKLNWQLRRVGLGVAVVVETEDGTVKDAKIIPTAMGHVTCDQCGTPFEACQEKLPACPNCGTVETG
jgi:hypothetical protein